MTVPTLVDRRVLVVGASAGIGQAVAERAVEQGAHVLLAARRKDVLDEIVLRTGGGTAVLADVCDPAGCVALTDAVATTLDTAELVLISVGTAPLTRFAGADPAAWRATFETNVIGIHQAISALLPRLAPGAMVAVVSSEIVDFPRHAMGVYGATKAALEHAMQTWRVEHPGLRFCTVVVGATMPTEFAAGFTDVELLLEALGQWGVHGVTTADIMSTDEVADALVGTFASVLPYPRVGMERLVLRTPSAVVGSPEQMMAKTEESGAPTGRQA